jgi:PAS domain-containing protein
VVTAASAWTVATGLLVLAGWTLDVPTLTRVLPGLPAMVPLAAAAFILAGIGLWLLGPAEAAPLCRRTGRVLALAVAVLGLLVLGEWVIGCDFGVDRMLFRGVLEQQLANGVGRPGRPPPHTAAAFTAAGLALALLDADRRPGQRTHVVAWRATFPAVLSTALALTALLGYVYGVAYLRGVSTSTGMAVHTAMGVLALNAGILVARPDRPVVRAFLARGPGGLLARRLAPTLLLLPFAIGLLGLAGAQADSDDPALGITVTTAGTILVLVVVVARTVHAVDAADAAQQRLFAELREQRDFVATLLHSMHDGVVVVDRDTRVVEVNPAWCAMTGLTREQLLGLTMSPHTWTGCRRSKSASPPRTSKVTCAAPTAPGSPCSLPPPRSAIPPVHRARTSRR